MKSLWGHKKRLIFLEVLKPEIRLWKRNKQKKNPNPNNQRTLQLQDIPQLKAHCRNATSCISILFILRVPHQVKSNAEIVRKLSVIRRPMSDLSRECGDTPPTAPSTSLVCAWLAATEPLTATYPCQGLHPVSFLGHYVQRLACYWEKRHEKPSG